MTMAGEVVEMGSDFQVLRSSMTEGNGQDVGRKIALYMLKGSRGLMVNPMSLGFLREER